MSDQSELASLRQMLRAQRALAGKMLHASMEAEDELLNAIVPELNELIATTRQEHKVGGSVPGRTMVCREREAGYQLLLRDYLGPNATHSAAEFEQRFGLPLSVLRRIADRIEAVEPAFGQRTDATGRPGFTSLERTIVSSCLLCIEKPHDVLEVYVRMGDATLNATMKEFCRYVIRLFGPDYMRHPSIDDLIRIFSENEARGFSGLAGSIGSTHWGWLNCPPAWTDKYRGKQGRPSIELEAVATSDHWLWHACAGVPGSTNATGLLSESSLLEPYYSNTAPRVSFSLNGETYQVPYYFANETYPPWASFVKPLARPIDDEEREFNERHKSIYNEVEETFAAFRSRFFIIRKPTRLRSFETLRDVMLTCVILHNMVVELRREPVKLHTTVEVRPPSPSAGDGGELHNQRVGAIRSEERHRELAHDVMEQFWKHSTQ